MKLSIILIFSTYMYFPMSNGENKTELYSQDKMVESHIFQNPKLETMDSVFKNVKNKDIHDAWDNHLSLKDNN